METKPNEPSTKQPDPGCTDPMAHFRRMRELTALGDYGGALAYASRLAPVPGSFLAFYTALFSGHAKLALGLDHTRLLAEALERERSAAWLTTERLSARLQAAIRDRVPLSMIRLGDGEARFLALGAPWARDLVSHEEAQCIVSLVWENWFGQPIAGVATADLRSLSEAFDAALADADILGVSPVRRYQQQKFTRGYLGVLERVVGEVVTRHQGVALTSAFAHAELQHRSSFYQELLAGLDFLGVIGPHPGLARRLAQFHDIGEVREYVVPGESRLPDFARGRSATPHFPDRFNEVMASLQVPRPGAVFLVAAGLLGKVYCHRIRQLGGIAIDAGSIVDAWMGFVTRPGQHNSAGAWVLPAAVDAGNGGATATAHRAGAVAEERRKKAVQRRFWSGGRHVWISTDDADALRSSGLLGPL